MPVQQILIRPDKKTPRTACRINKTQTAYFIRRSACKLFTDCVFNDVFNDIRRRIIHTSCFLYFRLFKNLYAVPVLRFARKADNLSQKAFIDGTEYFNRQHTKLILTFRIIERIDNTDKRFIRNSKFVKPLVGSKQPCIEFSIRIFKKPLHIFINSRFLLRDFFKLIPFFNFFIFTNP